MSLVRAKKNPVTGAIVVADVVLNQSSRSLSLEVGVIQGDIIRFCRETLSSHKVPAMINFVPTLAIAESGKMMRGNA